MEYYFLCISSPSFHFSQHVHVHVLYVHTCVVYAHGCNEGLSLKRELVWRPETPGDPPVSATLELHACAVGF